MRSHVKERFALKEFADWRLRIGCCREFMDFGKTRGHSTLLRILTAIIEDEGQVHL